MKNRVYAASLVLAALVVAALFTLAKPAGAQNTGVYEYGYVVPVQSVESYQIEIERWAGEKKNKEYLASHVFVYERGDSVHVERLNSLMLLNKLAQEGWELADAQAGVIRRKR
jgi:hypothetical protein